MADKPLSQNLPADLPTNWTYGQTVAPQGSQAGLATQYGYNYLMQQVNNVQTAANTINNAFTNLATESQLPGNTEIVYTLSASYSGTNHALTGLPNVSGLVSCVFTAAANYTAGDTFTINGTSYAIQLSNGETAEDNLFVSGATVSVILDTGAKKVNFKPAGGAKLPAETMDIVKIFTENGTFVVPQTGNYKVTVIGKGGKGEAGGATYDSWKGGGGGGTGGAASSLLSLFKGEDVAVTADDSVSSFGSYLSATAGQGGSSGESGAKGIASGGNLYTAVGSNGSSASGNTGGKGGVYTAADAQQIPYLVSQSVETTGSNTSAKFNINVSASGFASYGCGGNGGGGSSYSFRPSGADVMPGAVIVELVLD